MFYETCEKEFPELASAIDNLQDRNIINGLGLKQETMDKLVKCVSSQLEDIRDGMKTISSSEEIMVMMDHYLSLSVLIGVYLGETMKAKLTAEEIFHA